MVISVGRTVKDSTGIRVRLPGSPASQLLVNQPSHTWWRRNFTAAAAQPMCWMAIMYVTASAQILAFAQRTGRRTAAHAPPPDRAKPTLAKFLKTRILLYCHESFTPTMSQLSQPNFYKYYDRLYGQDP